MQENEITKGILDDLERRFPGSEQDADKTLSGTPQVGLSEAENDALCYWVLKKSALSKQQGTAIQVGSALNQGGNYNDCIEAFRQTYVEPVFDYIDENIDDKRMALALLNKYKHRCEWFRREEMLQKFEANTAHGEEVLALSLYDCLHDQGMKFHIEPWSATGNVDLISAQTGKDRLIADAKIFDAEGRGVAYIKKAFHQVYQYTKAYNEIFGYLVIFKICENDLAINAPQQEATIPFIVHNNKTIFLITIDISPRTKTTSKLGPLKSYEITRDQLVESLPAQ